MLKEALKIKARVLGSPWAAVFSAVIFSAVISGNAALAQAPGPPPRDGDEISIHVVEAGETLSAITQRYLGVSRLWRENHRLNPTVRDPDLLKIGQRLRIISYRKLPQRVAEIVLVERRVDEKIQPRDWTTAREGDTLRRNDGVRTEERSSAELEFDDGTNLTLSENSLVYLRQIGRRLTGVSEQTIEIDRGEADLQSAPARAGSSEIEVIISGATARPTTGRSGRNSSRLRKTGAGTAEVMIYDGSSEVEAQGQTVDVATGMGTSVPEGEVPRPPERLLPAPDGLRPAQGESFGYGNPTISWTAIPGAVGYSVEVCRDRGCSAQVARHGSPETSVTETSWRPPALPPGDFYWRVRATSATGLDGFPSRPLRFRLDGPQQQVNNETIVRPDLTAPTIDLSLIEPGRAANASEIFLAPGGALMPAANDDASGVARLQYRWDGGNWRRWRSGALAAPEDGELHQLELQATDIAERQSGIRSFTVQRLLTPPEPPVLRALDGGIN